MNMYQLKIDMEKKYIEQITTILRVSVERIQEIEEKMSRINKRKHIESDNFRKGVDEIKEIVRVCQKNEVKVTDGCVLEEVQLK